MAIVIKNTFLDVAEHKFLHFDEPCGADRRSQSVPRQWKPITPSSRSLSNTVSTDSSTHASPRSNLSFFSAIESSERLASIQLVQQHAFPALMQWKPAVNAPDLTGSDWSDDDGVVAGHSANFDCPTPTSSLGSPCSDVKNSCSRPCFCEQSGFGGSEMDRLLCYLTSCTCELGSSPADEKADAYDILEDVRTFTCMDCATNNPDSRTKLKSDAPAFQPEPRCDARMDAVANAICLAILSCGQAHDIKTERNVEKSPNVAISAQMQLGLHESSRCYDVVQLGKQAMEAVCERLPTLALLSARVQKEEGGYNLRANVAGLPEGAEDRMCWDLFRQGHCPRRSQCRWYHPQSDDIFKIKVSIRYAEEVVIGSGSEQEESNSPPKKHKISLGELV